MHHPQNSIDSSNILVHSQTEKKVQTLFQSHGFTQILGLPVMRVAGVEADDVIGTVATRAREEGFVVAIASPDKVS